MPEWIEKWLTGVATAITLAMLAWVWNLYLTTNAMQARISALESTHMAQWPLEKQLMLYEHETMRARIAVNEANVEELENELREIR